MCGIVGFVGTRDEELLARLNKSQFHRGPDEGGSYFSDRDLVSLAMRRLSILDLAGGHQPMHDATERLTIVFNGEIFNAPALRRELEAAGVKFLTDHSDTEVVLNLYGRYGRAGIQKLNGMFAFVIHDREKQLLFGARDRLGIKPLNYAWQGKNFAFASEHKSLLLLPWVDRALDRESFSHYLSFQCVPAPRSIYTGINKIPAGGSFVFDLANSRLTLEQYWQPSFDRSPVADFSQRSWKDKAAYVSSELEAAAERWMLSDVPVGFSLSGGLDSSTLLGLVARRHGGQSLKTYSLGFSGSSDLDETSLARLVAEKWKTQHTEIILEPEDLLADLDAMVTHLDEPYAGGLPSWFVFKRMARDVKVAMTGSGGDEIFGNYGRWRAYHRPVRAAQMLRLGFRRGADAMDLWRYPHAFLYPMYFRGGAKRDLLLNSQPAISSEQLLEDYWQKSPSQSPRDAITFFDMQMQLPEEFLHMTDRFSMAHSLEARTPFLDHEFVEKMLSLPNQERASPLHLKKLLLEVARDVVPDPLLNQRKRGFVLPMTEWTRGRLRPHVENLLGATYLREQGIFNPKVYDNYIVPHLKGDRDLTWQIWTLLFFQFWYERCVKNRSIGL